MNNDDTKKISFWIKFGNCLRDCFVKETGKPNCCRIIFMITITAILVVITWLLQKSDSVNNSIIGYVAALLIQFFLCSYLLIGLIPICVDEKTQSQLGEGMTKGLAVFINLLFLLSSFMLMFNELYLNMVRFKIISFGTLFLMAFCLKKCVRIKYGDKISYLKEMNHFLTAVFTAFGLICLLFEKCGFIDNFIKFHFLFPLLLLKSPYEAFDRKSKKPDTAIANNIENGK